jgi:hypothetical protein
VHPKFFGWLVVEVCGVNRGDVVAIHLVMEEGVNTAARHAAVHVQETLAAERGNSLIDDLPAFAGRIGLGAER